MYFLQYIPYKKISKLFTDYNKYFIDKNRIMNN